MALIVEQLNIRHNRRSFSCGVPILDGYLHERANQDVKRRLGNCFVATEEGSDAVVAYYTLAASSIPFDAFPPVETKRLPHYEALPATLVGRLAVDSRYWGRSIGSMLMANALMRTVAAAPASFSLVVDAKDDKAVAFYRKHGFQPLNDRPRSLFLPIATALKLMT